MFGLVYTDICDGPKKNDNTRLFHLLWLLKHYGEVLEYVVGINFDAAPSSGQNCQKSFRQFMSNSERVWGGSNNEV